MSANSVPDFVCPACRSPLNPSEPGLLCARCDKTYRVVEGIPIFVDEHEWREFYEGRWAGTTGGATAEEKRQSWRAWYKAFRYQYRWQRTRFFASALRRYASGRLILDIGCGGGQTVFSRFGPTIGVDLSYSSLQSASRIYQRVALSDMAQLPFNNEVFDVVASAEVLGHIPNDTKDAVLYETKRVLHPGGVAIYVIETMGAVRRFAQRLDSELFERYFVQQYGHVGMESPSETIARIERCGFETVYARSRWSLIWWPKHYLEGFDNAYRQRSQGLNLAIGILAWLHSNPAPPVKMLREGLNMFAGFVAPVMDALLPFDSGNILYAVFRKPET